MALLGFYQLQAQPFRSKIHIVKDDTSLSVTNGDTTYIYNAFIQHPDTNEITTLTLTAKVRNQTNTQWVSVKDTSYTWNTISLVTHNNVIYKICKPNANTVKICLGRLYFSVRQNHIIELTESNRILTKEFDF